MRQTKVDRMLTQSNVVSDSTARAPIWLRCQKIALRRGTIDNRGGFTLLDPRANSVVAGVRFNLTAQDVVKICKLQGGPLFERGCSGYGCANIRHAWLLICSSSTVMPLFNRTAV
jgi:hypothetical protein